MHPDDEQLEAYALGRLPSAALDLMEEHLLICQDCQEKVELIDDLKRALSRVVSKDYRPSRWRTWRGLFTSPGWRLRMIPLAGTLAVAAAVGFTALSPRPVAQGPRAEAALGAMRDGGSVTVVPAGRELGLQLDVRGLDLETYRVAVVDSAGRSVWTEAGVGVSGETDTIPVGLTTGLRAGIYYVRLLRASNQLAREYQLEAR